MNFTNIAAARLVNQHIADTQYESPKELVSWMGALQAQDYRMAKWAMGVRLSGLTLETVEAAIECGDIIRTHLLRPTWHFVAADDLRWMLNLTAPRVKIAMRSRHKSLGLTDELITKSNTVIADALARDKCLIRKELVGELEDAGFENKDNMASHLLLRAELDGVICSGPSRGKEYTYALLDKRVPESPEFTKDEALAKLAQTYFRSHGPATLEDFVWWSGLTKTSAQKALEMIKPDFISEEIDSQMYWFSDLVLSSVNISDSAYLLPAYDEYLISYKDRSSVIGDEHHKKAALSTNGIFRPVIVVNGQIVGIWKRSINKEVVSVETSFFTKPDSETKKQVGEAAEKFAKFLGKELEVKHNLS